MIIVHCRGFELIVSLYLLVLLVIFALFGCASTYLVKFIYCYWVKKRVEIRYVWWACLCALLIIPISLLSQWLL
ncbi:hypothetical protein NH568_23405 [Pseudoalteromonas sp. XMcav2-N]|nr:hypothetical protein [Pseudoalteromonas sp. XMcav2-N]